MLFATFQGVSLPTSPIFPNNSLYNNLFWIFEQWTQIKGAEASDDNNLGIERNFPNLASRFMVYLIFSSFPQLNGGRQGTRCHLI